VRRLSNIHDGYINLMHLTKNGLVGVGNEAGEVIIPPSLKYVRLTGGLLVGPDGVMLRDGTVVKAE